MRTFVIAPIVRNVNGNTFHLRLADIADHLSEHRFIHYRISEDECETFDSWAEWEYIKTKNSFCCDLSLDHHSDFWSFMRDFA